MYHRMDRWVPIGGRHEWNIDGLLQTMWDDLKLVRIFTKPKDIVVRSSDGVVASVRSE